MSNNAAAVENISYRKLNAEDSLIYRKVRLECLQKFPDSFGTRYEDEILKAELPFEKFLKENSQDEIVFGVFADDILIGICGFIREKRTKTRHRGEIVGMYIKPDFAGRNIGFELLKLTIEHAFADSEIEQITLGVVAESQSANKLYERVGFVEYGLLKNYFKSGNKYWSQRFMVLNREKSL